MSEEKFYSTQDPGVASFIWYVTAGEGTFVRVDVEGNTRPTVWFRDEMKNNPCSELEKLYHEGAQLRDVKEFCQCYRHVANEIRTAYKKFRPKP